MRKYALSRKNNYKYCYQGRNDLSFLIHSMSSNKLDFKIALNCFVLNIILNSESEIINFVYYSS